MRVIRRVRELNLEHGSGIRTINFDGPIGFCVVARHPGGAFVIFSEKLGELAAEFDAIIPAGSLRPAVLDAVQRGMRRTLERG